MFEFRKLMHFIAVAEELNVGRAAIRLHMSQPPLSRSIQQLEESLGVQLFSRSYQGVELTSEGEVFLAEARKILQMVDRAYEVTNQAKLGEIGCLNVGYYGSGIFDTIPSILKAFKQTYPKVGITLINLKKNEQIQALRDRRIHVGFIRYMSEEPDIVTRAVASEAINVAMPENHPLASKSEVTLLELSAEPLLLYPHSPRPSFADQVIAACRKAGFTPNVAHEAEDGQSCLALVASGLGIALSPESLSKIGIPGVVYRPLIPNNWSAELSCIHCPAQKAPVLEVFLECLETFIHSSTSQVD